MTVIDWRIGIEIELLAPEGKSRLNLAMAISDFYHGRLRRIFHPQSEPSKVPGTPIFHNLTLGYEVLDKEQNRICQCVDDLTLQADLDRNARPKPDWYRVISDDERLLRLIKQQSDPEKPLTKVLDPIAKLFGTTATHGEGGMIRVNDLYGASIAIAAPLPGERERPCELITIPLEDDHEIQLEQLLSIARKLQFRVPHEGATHIHFDATSMQSAHAIANLVNLFTAYGDMLKVLFGCNPNCRRLGNWPDELIELVNSSGFRQLSWTQAQVQLKALKLTKYCDLNLVNCIHGYFDKNTIEVRILPVWLETTPILQAASLFVAIFKLAQKPDPIPRIPGTAMSPESIKAFSKMLSLADRQVDNPKL